MTETPFGSPDAADTAIVTDGLGNVLNGAKAASSIVDTLLDLDELLSSDVRLAERSAIFYTRPDLEARIGELNAELDGLTDSQGRPQTPVDASVGDGVRSAHVVALEIREAEQKYAASKRIANLRQMDEDDWAAFLQRHKAALAEDPPYPPDFYEDLIVRSNARLIIDAETGEFGKPFTAEQVRGFRKKFGHPAFNEIFQAAWAVNSQSGVSVPKSWLSSAVLKHIEHG